MRNHRIYPTATAACLCLTALLGLWTAVFAQEARLSNIIVTNTRDDLLVYLNVEGAFSEKVTEAVAGGIPVTFTFFIELYQNRNYWLDRKIVERQITHKIRYDTLKKEYHISRSWESGNPKSTKSFEHAKRLMTEVDSLKVTELSRLEKESHYQLRAKAELSRKTLPLYLHYVLFFVSLWDFETDWYAIDFIY